MIRLLVLGFAEGASKMRRLARARGRPEGSARQSESVKGEPRFRRRPRRRPLSASRWLEHWAYRPSSPPTCATLRLASKTPIASNGSRLTASSPYASSSSPLSSPSWPSSPYCPPSHDEMAISEQCNRESSALRSDYYSNTQKTANPLNEWWTTTERRDARSALRSAHPRVHCACERSRRASRPQFLMHERNACAAVTSAIVAETHHARAPRVRIANARRDDAINRLAARGAACKKIFHRSGRLADARAKNRVERSESVQVIRGARPVRGRFKRVGKRLDAAVAPDSHTPSLRLSSSLAACGLARPPDARIT